MDFCECVQRATGFHPYPYQQRLADEGLPDLLRVPTGAGKSVAAVLPWLWRRLYHHEEEVRAATPRRLVVALPLRTLVEQFADDIETWLARLGLEGEVGLHVLLGGRRDDEWRTHPERESIVLGSIDMLLSRALNRGYASSRYRWPMEFGLLNTDSHWVFDEVQLLGAALPTSRQLQAFRDRLGTWRPTHSTWMSATVDPSWLPTVDAPQAPVPVGLGEVPAGSHLARVVGATRRIEPLLSGVAAAAPQVRELAKRTAEVHLPATRTLVFVNTVDRARKLAAAIRKAAPPGVDVVLVHSRFRPADRARLTRSATTDDLPESGRIVVSTQALEAGVDISSHTLITEICAWSSLVQRAGRCNRRGEAEGVARLLWVTTKHAAPYDNEQVAQTSELLEQHDGQAMTGAQLADLSLDPPPSTAVLRRRDLEALFDTLPDLSGDDVDVSPYVRDADDRDVFVAWRHLEGPPAPDDRPTADELVRVPIGEFRDWIRTRSVRNVWWQHDHIDRSWQPGRPADLRPGRIVLVAASEGGYSPLGGWDPTSRAPVEPVVRQAPVSDAAELDGHDRAVDDDPLSRFRGPVALTVHLRDTEQQARALVGALGIDGLPADDVCAAARLHDLGKAHPVFQAMLRDDATPDGVVLAKSRSRSGPAVARRGFRHEAASLAALRAPGGERVVEQVGGRDQTLVRYLVAAHHGKVRIGVRPLPSRRGGRADWTRGDVETALGLAHGEQFPAVDLGDGVMLPPTTLDVEALTAFAGPETWLAEVLGLLARDDLGPFRLAFLEGMVVLADWRASGSPSALVKEDPA
jgi:CRISPR-associated endonuclease/helicase Cas3